MIRPISYFRYAFIVALAAAGTWTSDQLLALHDRVETHGSLILKWCSAVSSGGGCEIYAASSWSEIHLPIIHALPIALPVALLGWIYFSAFGLWYLTGNATGTVPRWRRWVTIGLGVAGLYGSLFFVSIMAFNHAPWCIACLATHCINLALLTFVAFDVFGKQGVPKRVSTRWSPAIALGLLILLVGLLNRGRSAARDAQATEIDLKPFQQMVIDARKHADLLLAYYHAQPIVSIPLTSLTAAPSRHRLVVFTDLQCPACAANAIDIDQKIKPLFGNSLTIEIRQFPLCTSCNPFAASNVHPDACEAAIAAEAARQMGGETAFESMVAALHSHYAVLSPAIYDVEATRLHLPLTEFHREMLDPRARHRVDLDILLGNSLGVASTPTLFLDGRRVPEMCMTDEFWRAAATTAGATTGTPTTAAASR